LAVLNGDDKKKAQALRRALTSKQWKHLIRLNKWLNKELHASPLQKYDDGIRLVMPYSHFDAPLTKEISASLGLIDKDEHLTVLSSTQVSPPSSPDSPSDKKRKQPESNSKAEKTSDEDEDSAPEELSSKPPKKKQKTK
jgi:hypothetical protein